MEPKSLLRNPGTAPFSRIKYLARYGRDEQMEEFINDLFQTTVEGRYKGDWADLERLLERWEDVAINLQFQKMAVRRPDSVPWTKPAKPLHRSKIALVTTGGVYLDGQTPYSQEDDISYRVIPVDASPDRFRIWHPGYDHRPAEQDINCIFPISRFRELASEGLIGEQAESSYSFMGLINDTVGLTKESAPEVGRKLREDGVDAVFLAST